MAENLEQSLGDNANDVDIPVPDIKLGMQENVVLDSQLGEMKMDPAEFDKLSPEEKHRIEHQQFHKKHKGHEAMHAEMVIILVAVLIVSQVLLVQWRIRRPKSYNLCTLILLWTVPFCISIHYGWYRFICVWSVFSSITLLVLRKAVWKNHITPDTPRVVYRVFLFMFRVSLTVGTIGYVIFLLTMLGVNLMLMIPPDLAFDFSFLCLYYGFYFGVVIRDLSDLCTTSIARKVGYYSEDGSGKQNRLLSRNLAPNVCAICGHQMFSDLYNEHATSDEKITKLTCGHSFHEYCIRGWVMVGKQQTCPYCSEKVDFKELSSHPWEKYNLMYSQLLEWIRYLVAWQPVIVVIVHFVTQWMGLE